MKYFYEYKEKNGAKIGGHNLEKINFIDNVIKLEGFDYDFQYNRIYWTILVDSKKIEYLKITPMEYEE